ncbi:MAG: discoidin domain-containing protein [Roseibacillus sp.]|jgi:signal transduction histidine kinase
MEKPVRITLIMLVATGMGSLWAEDGKQSSFADRIARLVDAGVRKADRRLAEIEKRLESLPELYHGARGSRFGFHSETIEDQSEPHWVQIDLRESWPIDSIVLVPVHMPSFANLEEGNGFPLRFKIEVSETKNKPDYQVVVDHTASDFENPGRYPVLFPTPGVQGRYVRITSTKHVASGDGFIWAMEEMMILSGNYNIAAARPREASSHEELFPNWSILRVNDGISRLGYPWDPAPSPTNGYLSAPSKSSTEGKWLIIDFEEEIPIDEVRVIPSTSEDSEVVGGRGYPTKISLELSNDPEFGTTVWRAASSKKPLGFPWKSAFVRPCEGTSARYLRVHASELFARGNQHSFALAEVQAYSRGKNVALGKPVRVSDQTKRPSAKRWAPEFAVDGYSSTNRLVELPTFLERIVERGILENERQSLLLMREDKIEFASAAMTSGVGTLGGVAVFGWLWMIVRQRGVRRRDSERLREQIARDLHDDIGSNLAGIVLISEVGTKSSEASPEIRKDFHEIKETAEQTSEAMRDIVWLIHVDKAGARDMLIKMRGSVELIVGDLNTTIESKPADFKNRPLGLPLRRNFFFAFKESLHNVRKHAQATTVAIRFTVTHSELSFEVADNGVGFDVNSGKESGYGLENLRRRAEQVNGRCKIDSIPEQGTTISFSAPLNRKNS